MSERTMLFLKKKKITAVVPFVCKLLEGKEGGFWFARNDKQIWF